MAEQTTQATGGTVTAHADGLTTIATLEDAITSAYDVALGKLHTNKVAPSLQRFRDNHKAHAETMRQWAARMSETPSDNAVIEEFRETVQDSVAQAHGFDGVFSTLRVAEVAIKLQYDQAMRAGLPDDTKATLRTCLKDEQEHLNFLEVATHGLPQV